MNRSPSEPLAGYPIFIEAPVAWGEMDSYQHVNNTVYFRWFESARIAYFEAVGMTGFKERTGIGPILASTRCRFRVPLTYPDSVSVGTRVPRIGTDRFTMDYRVISRSAGEVAAEGEGLIVTFDYRSQRKAPIPDELKSAMVELERRAGNRPEDL